MRRFSRLSLQNKILFSFLVVTITLSGTIALLARWILVSSLTSELEMRGRAIAHSVAEHGAPYVLDKDYPRLLNLIVEEAYLRERDKLVSYIFIADRDSEVMSSTFFRPFPPGLSRAHVLEEDQDNSMREVMVDGEEIYDIAAPVREGLYLIGSVHVGLSKAHMENLVAKLRNTFLGFISAVIIMTLIMSHFLSEYIARPLSRLSGIADEFSRGNFDVELDSEDGDDRWEPSRCSAYVNTDLPCWHFDESEDEARLHTSAEASHKCATCAFYSKREGDEVVQLEDSFRNMLWSIRLYRHRLRESEEKYRSLFDSGPDPVLVFDAYSLEILDVNPRAKELYGYGREEMLGQSLLMLGPDHRDQHPLGQDSGGLGACVYYPKVIHLRKDGSPIFTSVHACPISYRGHSAVIMAVTDITEMIEKDAQLIQAAKMKSLGEMSAGVAHEINQPLNTIQLGSELLAFYREQGMDIPQDKLDKVVDSIQTQVGRAKEIIDNLRAFGRKAEIFKESVDLNAPIRNVLSIIRKQFELDNIRFQLDLAEDLPPVQAHDNRLQQVFFNLMNNARDAVNEQSAKNGWASPREIRIRTVAEGEYVLAEVSDTGAGVSESVRSKVFEPFFTTKDVGKGTGLGLAISFGIVRDYGGDIEIDSAEDGGALFRLRFPALRLPEQVPGA